MIQLIILLVIVVIWIGSILEYDEKPHCDWCAGDDCPFPTYDCERRKALKKERDDRI